MQQCLIVEMTNHPLKETTKCPRPHSQFRTWCQPTHEFYVLIWPLSYSLITWLTNAQMRHRSWLIMPNEQWRSSPKILKCTQCIILSFPIPGVIPGCHDLSQWACIVLRTLYTDHNNPYYGWPYVLQWQWRLKRKKIFRYTINTSNRLFPNLRERPWLTAYDYIRWKKKPVDYL